MAPLGGGGGGVGSNTIFAERYLIHTTDEINANAQKLIDKYNVQTIGPVEIGRAELQWSDPRKELKVAPPEPRRPMAHQRQAIRDTLNGFRDHHRGRLIMACGTGKTFTALKIAERLTEPGQRVLYVVPSLALITQAQREWTAHAAHPIRTAAVCSDSSAARRMDGDRGALAIPPTTDPADIGAFLRARPADERIVVFATYQSLPQIVTAQAEHRAPTFDLIFCDEAHRTTGVERVAGSTERSTGTISPFQLIHDDARLRGRKRLYMTATPRLITRGGRVTSSQDGIYTMDDETVYGPEFHRLSFSDATNAGILCDYHIVVVTVDERLADQVALPAAGDQEGIDLSDTSKCLALFSALHRIDHPDHCNANIQRVITFANNRKRSKAITEFWNQHCAAPADSSLTGMRELGATRTSEMRHVDGMMPTARRHRRIHWLDQPAAGQHTHLLSNVRVLGEGVDVPALDAIAFIDPRESPIDIVQAVGRAMRRPAGGGKDCGYIVVPIAIPAGADADTILRKNRSFETLHKVLNALRAHDERLDRELNTVDLNQALPQALTVQQTNFGHQHADTAGKEYVTDEAGQGRLQLLPDGTDIPVNALIATIADRCADSRYWSHWVNDIADIFERIKNMIQTRLDVDPNGPLSKAFNSTARNLDRTIGVKIGGERVVDIVAQHVLVRRIFRAIFPAENFLQTNPLAKALDRMTKRLFQAGLEAELQDLEKFYTSVEQDASAITSDSGRQALLKRIYEEFICKVFRKEAEALGVVYTPNELVDFIVHSVDDLLEQHLGERLTDPNVLILDPFTGTGTFLAQLFSSGLIHKADLVRKYTQELHANEIMLLPYYIAMLNISHAFRNACRKSDVDPNRIGTQAIFTNIHYTDSFKAGPVRKGQPDDLFGESRKQWQKMGKRLRKQRNANIKVIMSNPPWRAKQASGNDFNPNQAYPEIDRRIAETYAKHGTTKSKASLYDQYKRALRWASDRIDKQGIVALVTNESWYTTVTNSGIRNCLATEFDHVNMVHLGGNLRDPEDIGGNVFDISVGVTILFLIKTGESTNASQPATIHCWDLSGDLTKQQKLQKLVEHRSIVRAPTTLIEPNAKHEWHRQTDETYDQFIPLLGSSDSIYHTKTRGFNSGNDGQIMDHDRTKCEAKTQRLIQSYNSTRELIQQQPDNKELIRKAMYQQADHVNWGHDLIRKAENNIAIRYATEDSLQCTTAPFQTQWVQCNEVLFSRPGQSITIYRLGGGSGAHRGARHSSSSTTREPPPNSQFQSPRSQPRQRSTPSSRISMHRNNSARHTPRLQRRGDQQANERHITRQNINHTPSCSSPYWIAMTGVGCQQGFAVLALQQPAYSQSIFEIKIIPQAIPVLQGK